mmetsp:Transcript_16105/g.22708  ORF Transcript_16105/g.22708 Transcript_16105/m.22708 type:complete len:842 (+) Transcript_16105:29-2554(+)
MGSCIPTLLSCCYKGQVKDFSEITDSYTQAEIDALRSRKWGLTLNAFRKRNRWFGKGGSIPSTDDLVIALLLNLYTGAEDNWERAQQEASISRDLIALQGRDPEAVEFYLSQLCTYLSLQKFKGSPDVQDFLLARLCRNDLRLSQRLYWHIQAFDSINPYANMFLKKIVEEGCRGAALFNNRLHKIQEEKGHRCRNRSHDIPAKALEPDSTPELPPQSDLEEGDIVEEGSTFSSNVIAGSPQHFQSNLYFIEALTRTSEELIEVPIGQRHAAMLAKLEKLNEFFFSSAARQHGGSDVIYIPFGSSFYQVRSIYPLECITFSTKERVPMLVCLEVRAIELEELTPLRRRHRSKSDQNAEEVSLVETWKETIANNISSLKQRLPIEFSNRSKSINENLDEGQKKFEPELDLQIEGDFSISDAQLLSENPVASDESEKVGLSHMGQWRDAPFSPSRRKNFFKFLGNFFGSDGKTDAIEYGVLTDNRLKSDGKKPLLSPGSDYNRKLRGYKSAMLQGSDMFEETEVEPNIVLSDESQGSPESRQQQHHSRVIFREKWMEKEDRLWQERKKSEGESREGWMLLPVIVKANDDLRQEQAVSQMVKSLHKIFVEGDVGVWLRPYEILAINSSAGLLEAIPDTVSLHALKRNAPGISLLEFFKRHFGAPGGVSLKKARSNFVESCAGYAIVCYLLQIKDRHNGNILLDAEGHMVHIDWGFVLGQSPGHNLGFESAPFKLTQRHVEVMGGSMSFSFQRFRNLCVRAFLEARRNSEKLILLVEMLAEGYPELPCFSHSSPSAVCEALRERFLPHKTTGQCVEFVIDMIDSSMASWSTPLYDKFQRCFVGIF